MAMNPLEEQFCASGGDYSRPGFLHPQKALKLLQYDLPRMHFQIAIMFVFSHSLNFVLKRLHLPRIASEISVGILLGPTLIGQFSEHKVLFPDYGDIFLQFFSRMGYIFFIFLWGVKMDPKVIWKAGFKGWIIGLSAGLLPLIFGHAVMLHNLKLPFHPIMLEMLAKVVSTQCFISFPVVASILVHLKIINTELGHLALSSSLISNLFDISTSAVSTSIKYWSEEIASSMTKQSFILLFLYLLVTIVTVKVFSYYIIKNTPKAKQVEPMFVVIMCMVLLASCLCADNIGLNHEVGAFIVGLSVPDGPPLGSTLVQRLETIVDGLLVPLMICYCGTKVNLVQMYDLTLASSMFVLIAGSLVAQVLSILVPALIFRVPPRDALALSFVMSSQGIVQIATHLFLLNSEIYDKETFSMMILSVLVIASIMDTLARFTYNYSFTYSGYQKRTIQHEGLNGELTLLACMYHFDDVYVMKKLLEASIPDEKSPVSVAVIHLVELVGRANPQLIDHKVGQNAAFASGSRSQEVFEFFTSFEHQYQGLVNVHLFTGISMLKFMHQDICGLGFKKSVSMIILPFHRKWNHQGKVISENENLRTVNNSVLEISPSSVGILIDRQKIQRSTQTDTSIYKVVVVFIGGADDREALYYGKRMARSPGVRLTLVRLVGPQMYGIENQWDSIMDTEALKVMKMSENEIQYNEEVVKDGADTTHLIHEIEESFNLVLVGRGHNDNLPQLSGLAEFVEFPELGAVGDIMANSLINNPLSILVVQQQIQKA